MKINYPRGHKKLTNAWAFYDWANSVYSLVISSAIFPIFYSAVSTTAYEEGNVPDVLKDVNNENVIFITTALAFLVVSVLSPVLSGIADYAGNKKRYMQFFCYLGALSCIGLAFFSFDYLWFSLFIYLTALVGFWGSLVFYNSYLPDVALPEQQDAVSAKGFSLGYLGSVLLLIFCLALIQGGFFPEDGVLSLNAVQWSFILVGLWWMGFAQITYRRLPLGNRKGKVKTSLLLTNGFRELKKIYNLATNDIKMRRYLVAFFVFSMAVQTVMLVATYFGTEEVEWGSGGATTGLIVSILLIQLVAILGAFIASKLSSKYGNVPTLVGINLLWVAICVYGYFVYTPFQFYVTAGAVGLVMGSIQSLARSTYSKLIPDNHPDTASFFSFFDVAEKVGIVIGMSLFTLVTQFSGTMRMSILFLVVFFIVGVVLLLRVPRVD